MTSMIKSMKQHAWRIVMTSVFLFAAVQILHAQTPYISRMSGTPCLNSEQVFVFFGACSVNSQSSWTVNGGGTIVSSSQNTLIVKWNAATTNASVSVSPGSCQGATFPTFTISSSPVPSVSIVIQSPAGSICQPQTVTFKATPVNGGSTPTYAWTKNGAPVGTSSDTYPASNLNSGDKIKVRLTPSIACPSPESVESNEITMSITVPRLVEVTVTPPAGTPCGSPTFQANVTNGGTNPSYVWYKNGMPVTDNGSPFPDRYSPSVSPSNPWNNNNKITCAVQSNEWCINNTSATSIEVMASVIMPQEPVINIAPSTLSICEGGNISFTATSSNAALSNFQWKIGDVPAGTNSATFTTNQFTSQSTVSVTCTTTGSCLARNTATKTLGDTPITVNPRPAQASVLQPYYINSGTSANLLATGATANETYRWYASPQSQTPLSTTTTPALTTSTTYYVAIFNSTTGCESNSRTSFLISMNSPPVANAGPDREITKTMGWQIILNGSATDNEHSNLSFEWAQVSPAAPLTDNKNASLVIKKRRAGIYVFRLTAKDPNGSTSSDDAVVTILDPPNNYNYVKEIAPEIKGQQEVSSLAALTLDKRDETITYVDGLGRPNESITRQGSPAGNDIVQPIVYDALGREAVKYLPYISDETNGWYKTDALSDPTSSVTDPLMKYRLGKQHQFYQPGGDIASDQYPYAEVRFDASPLNRVVEQGAPGAAWQPDTNNSYTSTDRTIKHDYGANVPNEVLLWTYTAPTTTYPLGLVNTGSGTTPAYYVENRLSRNKTKDEQHHQVIEYVDKLGRTVLKRVQATTVTDASTTDVNRDTNWASTYYIYDDYGSLVCVIPPEATSKLATEYYQAGASDVSKNSFLSRWAFRYAYDASKRMVEKQVPGAASVYMVYDNRDRLVLTQDGNQRSLTNKEWNFTKYDALNRPVLTGKYLSNNDRATMQNDVNTYYTEPLASGRAWFETYVGVTGARIGYDNKSFPTAPVEANFLSATYYDQHDAYIAPSGFSYSPETLLIDPETSTQQETSATINSVRIKGQVAAMLVRNLYTNQWMRTVNYYDAKYRVVQSISDHQKGTVKVSNIVDFTGKVLLTRKTYVVNGVTTTIQENPDYDHAGRLKWIKHSVNGGTEYVLTKNDYNELGQLVDKKLHSTNTNGTDAKQSVDFRYNIRGWLTRINDSNLTIEESDPKDYFGMNLAYNTDFETGNFAIPDKAHNGNISAIKWSVGLGEGAVKEMAYNFSYDAMNRLSSASHKQSALPNDWTPGQFDENVSSYDLNGNIKNLQRKGVGGVMIDDLVYHYGSGSTLSNKLLYVKDNTTDQTEKVKGFNDANPGDVQDYTYDDNGNLTRDLNKGIGASMADANSKITYNFLNLPETVTKGENSIRYIYDATGRKLAQTTTFGAVSKEVDYIGELQFENNVLQFINHAEGRVVMAEKSSLTYTHNGETPTGLTLSNATSSLATQNGGEKYLQVTSSGTVARTGISRIGNVVPVTAGEKYKIRLKGYRTGTSFAYVQVKTDGTDLNWPGAKLPFGVASESWIEQVVTIPANKTTLEVGLVWDAVTAGQVMFFNEFELIKIAEAVPALIQPEYQYFIKDHLGNVRVTFTTKVDEDQSLATLEALRAPQEEGKFIYYDEAVKVNAKVFDHSDQQGTTNETPPAGSITIHVEAENFTSQLGTTVSAGTVGYCDTNDWLQYNGINLTGITALKLRSAAAWNLGRVEIRVGSTTGTLLGSMQGTNTGSWETFSTFTIPLTASTGVQNVVLVFKGGDGVMNLDWLEFTGPGSNGLPVKSITLQNTSLALAVGQTGRLLKTIIPAEATNQAVTWSSNNTAVAVVNSSGVVTAQAIGTATISVSSTSCNCSAKAVIHVKPSNAAMLTNSEFETNATPWQLGDWTGPGYTPTSGNSLSVATVSGFSGTKAMFINVVTNKNDFWTLQPFSPLNFKIEVGKTYEVSFMAKAESTRGIAAALRGEQTNTDFWRTDVSLTTTPQTFGPYQFTCTDNMATANTSFTMAFYLSTGVASDVWIDKVIVRDITPGGTPATGVTVTPSTLSLLVGQPGQLTANVLPANALNEVTWTSSNPAVAVVNKSGKISALSAGTSTITATSITGNYTASSTVTVTTGVINLVTNGEFDSGMANWTPGDWTGPGLSPGGTPFTIVTGAGMSGTNALKVDVINNNNQVWTLQPYNLLNAPLQYGKSYEVSFMAKGETVRDIQAVVKGEQTGTHFWETTVSLTTTPQTFGPYLFTCTNDNVNFNTSFTMAFFLAMGPISDVWIDKVSVKDVTTGFIPVTGLSLSPSRLALAAGATGQLTRNISPSTASNTNVVWSSSDTDVAIVNDKGVVTAMSTGTATITAKSADGAFTAQATVDVNPGITSYSTRLTGMQHHEFALAKSLSVMPGDAIELEVWAKYLDNDANNWTAALTTLMTQIAQGTAPMGTIVDGGTTGSIGGTQLPFTPINHNNDSGGEPKAYLNYIVFDRNMTAPIDYGFRRITAAAREYGQDGLHVRLAFDGEEKIKIKEAGYVYIYLSNENDTPVEVYFDDFKVAHVKGPIVSSQDYYPFGLTFNSYQRENSVDQKYLYSGKELQDELDVGIYDYGARQFDPTIGRFLSKDPHAENYLTTSPYVYALNNPILLKDDNGKDIIIANLSASQQKSLAQFARTNEGRAFLSQFAVKGKEYNIGGEKFTFNVKESSSHHIQYETGNISNSGETETYVYNPVKREYVAASEFGGDLKGARAAAMNKAGQFYNFRVTLDDNLTSDRSTYTIAHESFVHVEKNKKDLDQSFSDYKSGKSQQEAEASSLKGNTAENVLSSAISSVGEGISDHKLLVDGKVVKLETFVKALDQVLNTTKYSDQLKKDKQHYKSNPQ